MRQNSRPVTEREIAKRSYQDCCAGSPWDGRWPLTSSLSWKAERGRRKFTRTCGTKPSITWRDSPLFKTLNTWWIKSVRLSMVRSNVQILKHPTCLYIWPNPSVISCRFWEKVPALTPSTQAKPATSWANTQRLCLSIWTAMNIYPPALSTAIPVGHSSNSSQLTRPGSCNHYVKGHSSVRRKQEERRETDEAVAPGLSTQLDYCNDSLCICLSPVEDHKRSSRSGSRKNRGYSVGLGRSQSGGLHGQDDAALQ